MTEPSAETPAVGPEPERRSSITPAELYRIATIAILAFGTGFTACYKYWIPIPPKPSTAIQLKPIYQTGVDLGAALQLAVAKDVNSAARNLSSAVSEARNAKIFSHGTLQLIGKTTDFPGDVEKINAAIGAVGAELEVRDEK